MPEPLNRSAPMAKYRKKPVVIEAVQFDGSAFGLAQVVFFVGRPLSSACISEVNGITVYIPTLEGEMAASPGDWIVRGVKGEYYPCKPDIFEMTYEAADD